MSRFILSTGLCWKYMSYSFEKMSFLILNKTSKLPERQYIVKNNHISYILDKSTHFLIAISLIQ